MIKKEKPEHKILETLVGGLFYLMLILAALYIPYKTIDLLFPGDKDFIEIGFCWFFGTILYLLLFGVGYGIYANRKEIKAGCQSVGKKILGRKNDKKDCLQ